jgi:hypothetical protein
MPRKGKYTAVKKHKNQTPAIPQTQATSNTTRKVVQPTVGITATKTHADITATMPASAKYSELPSELRRVAIIAGFTLVLMIALWLILR